MVRKITGKSPSLNIKHLNINNSEITEIPDIASSLGQTFSNNSSSNNYSTKFQAFKNHAENQHLKFKSNNLETYNRLVWFFERNKLITPLRCGFRKQRSTTDHLVRFESFTREAFIQRQHAVAVFFDLEKAYDCTVLGSTTS